jgi:hypothetical protein
MDMPPQTAIAPPATDDDPRYVWVVYPMLSRLPFVGLGVAATVDEARAEAEHVMDERSEESGFAVILALDGTDKISRCTAPGVYQWKPCRLTSFTS